MARSLAFVDLEGVLVPEMWPHLANVTGEEGFLITTREEPDFHTLMLRRLELLRFHNISVAKLLSEIASLSSILYKVELRV